MVSIGDEDCIVARAYTNWDGDPIDLEEVKEPKYHLFISEANGVPKKYAFGEEWVGTALFVNDCGEDTPEGAFMRWLMDNEKKLTTDDLEEALMCFREEMR